MGIHQTASICNPSTNIARTSEPYYACLCHRITCHVVQCAALQICSTQSNKCIFSAFHLQYFCAQDIFFCNKSMMLNNFIIDFFPVSCTVFEVKIVTPNLATRWRCQWFPCIEHGNFTIPRPNFYDYSSCSSEIIGVTTDFS